MYHPRFKGTHYLMGQKMGSIFKEAGAKFQINLDGFQKDFGRESAAILNKYFPEAVQEIKGITDVTGIDNELFMSWMICMGCCLDISEGESVEVRGCTAFSFTHNGSVFFGRNNDLPPFLKNVSKSILYNPENANRFVLNTSSFINGEEGINESGLAVAMTFVKPLRKEIKPGMNSVFIVRYLLEKCRNVDECLKMLDMIPVASSCNILLADKSGKILVAECNPIKRNIRLPETGVSGNKFIVTVNNFTSPKMKSHDADPNLFKADLRYETAYHALKELDFTDGADHAIRILRGEYGFMCQYERKLNFDTIWSSVFDITGGRIFRAEGNPYKTSYKEDNRLVSKI